MTAQKTIFVILTVLDIVLCSLNLAMGHYVMAVLMASFAVVNIYWLDLLEQEEIRDSSK